jgi:hypothetical protein
VSTASARPNPPSFTGESQKRNSSSFLKLDFQFVYSSFKFKRFLVKHTIEEKMAVMLEKHRSALTSRSSGSVKENPVTLADLKDLLVDEGE